MGGAGSGPNRGRGRPRKDGVGLFGRPKPDGPTAPPPFGMRRAARIVEKNSRTMMKIHQLLELKKQLTAPGAEPVPAKEMAELQARLDGLKGRMNRRLISLSRYADAPPHEKQYHPRVHLAQLLKHRNNAAADRDASLPPPKVAFLKDKSEGEGVI